MAQQSSNTEAGAFRAALMARPLVWIGFACTIAWPWSLNSIFPQSAPTAQGSLVFLAFGLAGIAMALLARRGRTVSNMAVLLWGGFLYVATSLRYALSVAAPAASQAVYGPAIQLLVTLSGVRQALFFIRWIGAFGSM